MNNVENMKGIGCLQYVFITFHVSSIEGKFTAILCSLGDCPLKCMFVCACNDSIVLW